MTEPKTEPSLPNQVAPDPRTESFAALRDSLPDDLRAEAALSPYTSFEGMARSLVDAQRMIGKRIADASPDDLARIDERFGRPARPEDYRIDVAKESSAGDGATPGAGGDMLETAREWFFEAGLNHRQAEILARKWEAFTDQDQRIRAESRSSSEAELRNEWGNTFDQRVDAAGRAVQEFGGEDLARYLEETGLGNDPRLVRAFARIADAIGEDSLVAGESSEFGGDGATARGEIARIMSGPAYFDAGHPDHGKTVERMRVLFAAAYPDVPA